MRLQELGVALLSYAAAKGRLPSAAIYGADGRPLLSWRVRLLPLLDQQDLYRQFRLDEPWDSPHNLALLPRMPPEFAAVHPKQNPEPYHTFVHCFVGPGAAFEGTSGLRFPADFPNCSRTILLVHGGKAVPWTKPEDIPYATDQDLPQLATVSDDGFSVVMANGSVRFISKETNQRTLWAAVNRNGKGILDPDS
jgi:hypothetical protein